MKQPENKLKIAFNGISIPYTKRIKVRAYYNKHPQCYCSTLQGEDICMYCGLVVNKISKKEGIPELDIYPKKPIKRY